MQTTRPISRHEREQIGAWVKTRLAAEGEGEIKALLETHFVPVATHYTECCRAADEATGRYQAASVAADEQDEVFDGAFRTWVRTNVDAQGRSLSSELTVLLGMIPSDVVRLPYREELSRVRALLPRLPPHLQGDDQARAALVAAMDTFERLVEAQEKALGEKLTANLALEKANAAFDSAWGKQVRLHKALLSAEALRQIPVFTRTRTKPAVQG